MIRRYQRRRRFEFLVPFLLLIGIGVIGILGFQVWASFQGQSGNAYFYIAEGKAKVLPSGAGEWESAYNGTKMQLGDALKTQSGSKAVVKFYNDTLLRMNENTEISLVDVSKRNDSEQIIVKLERGSVWVNKARSEDVKESLFQVNTQNLHVKDVGTVFAVDKTDAAETVRVVKGNIDVDVLSQTQKDKVLETIAVGVGQEAQFDSAILSSFQKGEMPSVLLALSEIFKSGAWYQWNTAEDANPTDFSRMQTQQTTGSNVQGSQQGTNSSNQSGSQIISSSSTQVVPVEGGSTVEAIITQPSGAKQTVSDGKAVLGGTVPAGTKKVMVSAKLGDGSPFDYTLQKFKSGDTSFTYNLAENLGNIKSGENTYTVYIFNAADEKSDGVKVTISYNKATVNITDSLTAPKVLTYNGVASSTVTTGVVQVKGEVQGAEKVVVNGYTLSKFVAGDKTWTYFANEAGGNLKAGENTYEVYAVGPDGKQSEKVIFTITYNKPAGSSSGSTASTGSNSQQTGSTTQPAQTSTQVAPKF